jgi:hypothetical protein
MMNRSLLRAVVLCAVLVVAFMALTPPEGLATTCPPESCSAASARCQSLGGNPVLGWIVGTCDLPPIVDVLRFTCRYPETTPVPPFASTCWQ